VASAGCDTATRRSDLPRPETAFDVSGADLIQTLESLGRTTPVIVLSGWTQDLDRAALPSFVRAVIDKPVKLEAFKAAIDQVLQGDPN